jgi:hypothetical protein
MKAAKGCWKPKKTYKEGPMNLRTLAVFVIGLAAAGTIPAQSLRVQANIPFSFVVNGKTLPAGEYNVRRATSPDMLSIRAVGGGEGAFSTYAPTTEPSPHQGTARLVFHRYGNQYFLSEVWGSNGQGDQIPPTPRERELIAHGHNPNQPVVVALR